VLEDAGFAGRRWVGSGVGSVTSAFAVPEAEAVAVHLEDVDVKASVSMPIHPIG
jgi:hypothetical protein